MEQASAPKSWADVKLDTVREIVRQAELNMQQQAQVAQSIDQRATSVAGLSNAAATAILAFLGAQAAQGKTDAPLIAAGLTVAVTWAGSVYCSYQALKPRPWRSAGTMPRQWYHLLNGGELRPEELLGAAAEELDSYLATNHSRNEDAAIWLWRALRLAMVAPIIGLMAWAEVEVVVAALAWWAQAATVASSAFALH